MFITGLKRGDRIKVGDAKIIIMKCFGCCKLGISAPPEVKIELLEPLQIDDDKKNIHNPKNSDSSQSSAKNNHGGSAKSRA